VPLAKLFVEGTLEVQVLTPILLGNPVPQQGGSKYSLKPRARTERKENRVAAGYLRDRDVDFDPPDDLSKPTVDGQDGETAFGWRWCRHEIENYLIDPALVSEVLSLPIVTVEDGLREAAVRIRAYQAARWTVGVVRRALPRHYELRTCPAGLNEIALPSDLDATAVNSWAIENIDTHHSAIAASTDPSAVGESLDRFAARFDDALVADVANVLLWFSGKDLLAGMADWLITRAIANPGAFRALLRDWVIANPARTVELLPEWNCLSEVLRA
jgi:hypothetical protein